MTLALVRMGDKESHGSDPGFVLVFFVVVRDWFWVAFWMLLFILQMCFLLSTSVWRDFYANCRIVNLRIMNE